MLPGGRVETKKTAPKGGLRRSKHARVRGLGAESSLAPSLARRRLSGCHGANDFGVPRICPGRCHSTSVERVCPLHADRGRATTAIVLGQSYSSSLCICLHILKKDTHSFIHRREGEAPPRKINQAPELLYKERETGTELAPS